MEKDLIDHHWVPTSGDSMQCVLCGDCDDVRCCSPGWCDANLLDSLAKAIDEHNKAPKSKYISTKRRPHTEVTIAS